MSLFIFILALSISWTPAFGVNVTGNPAWDGLLKKCWKTASFSCVQEGLRETIEGALEGDLKITDSINFVKNENKYSFESNNVYDDEEEFGAFINAVEDSEAKEEKRAPKLILEPRSVDGISDILYNKGVHYLMTHTLDLQLPETGFGGGKIKIEPRSIEEDGVVLKIKFDDPPKPEGRIFLKKIRQVFKKKLMSSFMAAMLVIKLIKVKLMFLLPLVVGVGTAKKILLKVLLFIFPALTHLFKLCAYYHHQHTKYHLHHHHQIAHHHHHSRPVYVTPPAHEYDYPPPGAEIIHRSEPNNELLAWGIEYEEPKHEAQQMNRVYSVNQVNHPTNHIPQQPVYDNYQTNHIPQQSYAETEKPFYGPSPQLTQEDPFYSPILVKLDRVFTELGFTDEPCKERLVCSMYKNPERFSPHSNLVSAEISRDPSELQKPLYANPSVVRYFRYVQAARNGQDMKDCLNLYSKCSLLTE